MSGASTVDRDETPSDEELPIMAKVLCVLYDDPRHGYPTSYARDDIATIESYPGGPSGRLHHRLTRAGAHSYSTR